MDGKFARFIFQEYRDGKFILGEYVFHMREYEDEKSMYVYGDDKSMKSILEEYEDENV